MNILKFTKSALKCYVNITGTYKGEIVLKPTKSPVFRKSYENVTWSNENYNNTFHRDAALSETTCIYCRVSLLPCIHASTVVNIFKQVRTLPYTAGGERVLVVLRMLRVVGGFILTNKFISYYLISSSVVMCWLWWRRVMHERRPSADCQREGTTRGKKQRMFDEIGNW